MKRKKLFERLKHKKETIKKAKNGMAKSSAHTASRNIRTDSKHPIIRLELVSLKINRKSNKGWNIYFVLISKDTNNPENSIVCEFPEDGRVIDLSRKSNNMIHFMPTGPDASGETLYEMEMPENRSVDMQLFIFQSKEKTRKSCAFLSSVSEKMNKGASQAAKSGNPYAIAAWAVNKSAGIITDGFAKMKDKDRGMISLDETFKSVTPCVLNRMNDSSTGDIHLKWRWVIR